MKNQKIKWFKEPEEHDYSAAVSYLSLIYQVEDAKKIATKLKLAKMSEFKSKDIFRASRLSFLGTSNSHVQKNLKKIKRGKSMSPVLLVRDSINGNLIIADGYHRCCAVYFLSEDCSIPCKIVSI